MSELFCIDCKKDLSVEYKKSNNKIVRIGDDLRCGGCELDRVMKLLRPRAEAHRKNYNEAVDFLNNSLGNILTEDQLNELYEPPFDEAEA